MDSKIRTLTWTVLSLLALFCFFRLIVERKTDDQAAAGLDVASVDSDAIDTRQNRLPLAHSGAGSGYERQVEWFDSVTEEILEQTESNDGSYLTQTIIARTRFHYPFLRLDRTFYGSGHISEGQLVSEVISVANQFIIAGEPESSLPEIQALAMSIDASAESISGETSLYRIIFPDTSDILGHSKRAALLAELSDIVRYVESDALVHGSAFVPDDPYFDEQNNLANSLGSGNSNRDIDAPQAWETIKESPHVVIAIIDSGIRSTHEDLRNNLWSNSGELDNGVDDDGNGIIDDLFGYNSIEQSGEPVDDNGHGTHVAGIAGAEGNNGKGVAGVTWDVQLMPLKFLGETGYGATSDAIKCIDYAITKGADIINNSWGGSYRSDSLRETLLSASDAGILLVAAAGNESLYLDESPSFPAAFPIPNQVTVIAVEGSDHLAPYSNYSPRLAHIAAPARAISAFNSADDAYAELEGTSMAAPLVSGTLALLKAQSPENAPEKIMARLLNSVEIRSNLAQLCLSSGRLNLHRAVTGASNAPSNDLISEAEEIPLLGGSKSGSLSLATSQSNEPMPRTGAQGATVWYQWTPQTSGAGQLQLSPTGFAGSLSVFSGMDLSDLRLVNTDSSPVGEAVTINWTFRGNQRYYIQIDSVDTGRGPFSLELTIAPPNDSIASAILLEGRSFTTAGRNAAATLEENELPLHPSAAGASVWYRWIAPDSGKVYLKLAQTRSRLFTRVFVGSSMQNLAAVDASFEAGSQANLVFQADAGTSYLFAIDSQSTYGASFHLEGSYIGVPRILVHPSDQLVKLNEPTSFSVVAVGDGIPLFQWFKNENPIAGATGSALDIPAVSEGDLGSYFVEVSFPNQTLRSRSASLSLFKGSFQFLRNPAPASIKRGQTATLSALLGPNTGSPRLDWLKNGQVVPNSSTSTLTLENAQPSDSGFYQLRATDGAYSILSKPAYLVVSDRDEFFAYSWANASATQHPVNGIKAIGEFFVSTRSGPFSFSYDGQTWQALDFESGDVTWNGSSYTLISNKAVYTSSNLLHMELQAEFEKSLYAIAYGGGNYVIRAGDGIYHSTDARNWIRTLELKGQWGETVAFGNGKFVAARVDTIYLSEDGINWSSYPAPDIGGGVSIAQYGDGRWWLSGYSQVETIWTSEDAQSWSSFPYGKDAVERVIVDEFSDQVYLLLEVLDNEGEYFSRYRLELHRVEGDRLEYEKYLLTDSSPWGPPLAIKNGEGIISTRKGIALLDELTSSHFDNQATPWFSNAKISFANDQFIASTGRWLYSSSDGSSWTREASNTDDHGYGKFVYGKGVYLSENHVGRTLSSLSRHSMPISDIHFEEDLFVAVSWPNSLKYSTDGVAWNDIGGIEASHLAYGNGTFVAYSEYHIYSSDNGIDWSKRSIPNENGFSAMSFGNGVFVAFNSNRCYTSSDGVNWENKSTVSIPNHSSSFIHKIHFIDGEFIVPYWDNYYFASDDGTSWKQIKASPTLANVRGSILSNAAETGQAIVTSSDRGIAVLGQHVPNSSETIFTSHPKTVTSQIGIPVELRFLVTALPQTIDRIEIRINGELWETLAEGSRSYSFTPDSAGEYLVEVLTITNNGGEASDSLTIDIPPLLSVSKPSDEFSLNDLIFHKGAYYGVSDGGRVHLSIDGIEWKTVQTPTLESLNSIVANENGFVVGYQGKGTLFSSDGINWIQIGNFDSDGVVCDKGLFIAGRSATPMLSRDGVNWIAAGEGSISAEPDSQDQVFNAFDMSFFGGLGRGWARLVNYSKVFKVGETYVALGYYDVFTSENLAVWSELFPDETAYDLQMVGDLLFLRLSSGYRYTADGITWQDVDEIVYSDRISYSDGYYYTFTKQTSLPSPSLIIQRSKDTIEWEPISDPIPFESYAFRIGSFVASPSGLAFFAEDGAKYFFVSTDGSTYSRAFDSFGFRDDIKIIGIDPLIAVTDYQSYFRNGAGEWERTLTRVEEDTTFASGVYLGNWHFGLHRSVDGINWSKVPYPEWLDGLYFNILDLFSDGEYFWLQIDYEVNRVDRMAYARSRDGLNWERIDPQDNQWLFGEPIYFNGKIYSGWGEGVVRLSSDFKTHSQVYGASGNVVLAATESKLGALVGGYNGSVGISLSSDGDSWESHSLPATGYLNLTATNSAFYLWGESVWTSSDGIEWNKIIPYPAKVTAFEDNVLFYTDDLTFIETTSRDLSISDVFVSSDEYGVGDSVNFQITLKNAGQEPLELAEDAEIRYAFSRHLKSWNPINEGDGFRGKVAIPFERLAPLESRTISVDVTIPEGISPSKYFLSALVPDGVVLRDGNKSNDIRVASENAQITVPSRRLIVGDSSHGQVIGLAENQEFAWKDMIPLRAQPDFGYEFREWTGTKPYGEAFYLLTLEQDTQLTPQFTPRIYKVDLEVEGEGTVTGLPDSSTIGFGETLNLTAESADGWTFIGWEGASKEESNSLSATVGRDLALVARFVRTYNGWANERYRENVLDRSMLADPDNDGISNLEHFAIGLDYPEERTLSNLGWSFREGVLLLRYAVYRGLTEAEVIPEWTDNGVFWRQPSDGPRKVGETNSLTIFEAALDIPSTREVQLLRIRIRSVAPF